VDQETGSRLDQDHDHATPGVTGDEPSGSPESTPPMYTAVEMEVQAYSLLNDAMGSIRLARRAGRADAKIATPPSSTVTAA